MLCACLSELVRGKSALCESLALVSKYTKASVVQTFHSLSFINRCFSDSGIPKGAASDLIICMGSFIIIMINDKLLLVLLLSLVFFFCYFCLRLLNITFKCSSVALASVQCQDFRQYTLRFHTVDVKNKTSYYSKLLDLLYVLYADFHRFSVFVKKGHLTGNYKVG